MQICATILATLTLSFPAQRTDTQTKYEKLAKQMEIFQTWKMAMGRGTWTDRLIPDKWTKPWLKLHAAITTGKENTNDLVNLLKHDDPKVRTLALGALFHREDPQLLPHFARMVNDKTPAVPELAIRRAIRLLPNGAKNTIVPQDFHKQTVGYVAEVFLNRWLKPAGYRAKEFEDYWRTRKGRKSCASWFLMRLYRAGQATSAFDKKRAPLIRAVRKEVDALPAVDRDWTLIWLAAHHYQSNSADPRRIFSTAGDLLGAAKRLGPDRLMRLIQRKAISDDPDLTHENPRTRGRDDLVLWVLRNAGKLLRPKDATLILAAEKDLSDHPPECVIAAAELQPKNAGKWLKRAFSRFSNKYHRATLAAGLWRAVGENESDYLVDWFYGEKVSTNPHSPQTAMFLDAIKKVREPANRKLVKRVITDMRLGKLDYQSLRALATVINGWSKNPVIPFRQLYRNWEKGSWGPKTEADFKVLAEWRARLRKSVANWTR